MKIRCLSIVAASLFAAVLAPAGAQSVAPPKPDASVPSAVPGQRTLTAAEKRTSATPPDESRPEGPVVPQISIPIGRSVPALSKPALRAPSPAATSAGAGGINDAVARCESQPDEVLRARCRDRLAHQGKPP